MSPLNKIQMKAGAPITLLQLILSIVVLLLGGVGLYVKAEVEKAKLQDRVEVLEKYQAKQDANALARVATRNLEIKEINNHDAKQDQDIEILKATKKDK